MIESFAHYNLRAPRPLLEALREFYTDVVGLRVGERPPFKIFGYWLYLGAQDVLHLAECPPGEERAAGRGTTFDHAAFRCGDRGAMERHLESRGVPFRRVRVPVLGQTQLFLTDPAGNGVELNFLE